ncbi:MAG: DUF87 domain-containing protein [Cryobacterium sp.]|nr:DUF87 domain-containing protein [Cryobacterium sp.]
MKRAPSNPPAAFFEIQFDSAHDAETLLGKDLHLTPQRGAAQAAGVVAAGTTDDRLVFEPISSTSIGDPIVGRTTSGAITLFQVSGLRIEREFTSAVAVHEFVRAFGTQIGTINDKGRLVLCKEVLAPGSVVTTYRSSDMATISTQPGSIHIGSISGTELPVSIDPVIAVKGHMAVLGMTGMGKSMLTRRLASEFAKTFPVIVVDQTGEYNSIGLPASNQQNTSTPGLSLKNLQDSNAPHAEALKALQILEKLGREEFESNKPVTRRILILEEAHQFVPEPSMLGFGIAGRDESIKFGLLMMQVRKFGVSVVLVSQRTSVVAKSALSQCENIIAFKSVDQTGLDYLEAFGGPALRDLLPRLSVGEALTLGPSMSIQTPAIVKVLQASSTAEGTDSGSETVSQTAKSGPASPVSPMDDREE